MTDEEAMKAAQDPTTPSEVLRDFYSHHRWPVEVVQMAMQNPSFPADALALCLRYGSMSAWLNPSAELAILAYPNERVWEGLLVAARGEARLGPWQPDSVILASDGPVVTRWRARLEELLCPPAVRPQTDPDGHERSQTRDPGPPGRPRRLDGARGMTKPAKGSRTGAAARSGPSTPRAERTRRPVEITLGEEARALLDGEVARSGSSRSALVEALVLRHLGALEGS